MGRCARCCTRGDQLRRGRSGAFLFVHGGSGPKVFLGGRTFRGDFNVVIVVVLVIIVFMEIFGRNAELGPERIFKVTMMPCAIFD